MNRCPGHDARYWTPDYVSDVPCPHCGAQIEFFRTDRQRRCSACGAQVRNPNLDSGCAAWCRYAQLCPGAEPRSGRDLSSALIAELKGVFARDTRRVAHALEVLDWAERILAREPGDPLVVRAAALLLDVGVPDAEQKHGSAAAPFHQALGPPVATRILQKLHVDPDRTQHICRIVASHHGAGGPATPESWIVRDAVRMARLSRLAPAKRASARFRLHTQTARSLARQLFLGSDSVFA